jgi:hypothetical protein
MKGMFEVLPQGVNPPVVLTKLSIRQGVGLVELTETIELLDREAQTKAEPFQPREA